MSSTSEFATTATCPSASSKSRDIGFLQAVPAASSPITRVRWTYAGRGAGKVRWVLGSMLAHSGDPNGVKENALCSGKDIAEGRERELSGGCCIRIW